MPETTKINKINMFPNDCVQNICESEIAPPKKTPSG